ncbi:DUF1508 domain-containing protein [Nissabacter sp. SGAir0207]|uniref:DUF1508 domain-containing protein n=1 Tax=Nissabacter sp. SGAir0207 TaxID=2126321 RepID=UPI0010CCDD79|nr:DUF1508 domain-containing protein [Nissabacter sp. SGAir0207]QCR37999.1 hypothetical protein C1N62_17820 [Nissabacter sp. SGAir0207]
MKIFEIPYYYIYLDKEGCWRWRLMAASGELIAISPEGYRHLSFCEKNIATIARDALLAVSIGDESYNSKKSKKD